MPRTSQGKLVTEASRVFQKADDYWRNGSYDEADRRGEAGVYLLSA